MCGPLESLTSSPSDSLPLSVSICRQESLTFEFLEPYANGSCGRLPSCLACLSDSLCGWCESSDSCLPRLEASAVCPGRLLTLSPALCPACGQRVDCVDCTAAGCQWPQQAAGCRRAAAGAVTRPDDCPPPCDARSDCASCLGPPGNCSWCTETNVRASGVR